MSSTESFSELDGDKFATMVEAVSNEMERHTVNAFVAANICVSILAKLIVEQDVVQPNPKRMEEIVSLLGLYVYNMKEMYSNSPEAQKELLNFYAGQPKNKEVN